MFLLDSNVLSKTNPDQRSSELFRRGCRIPSEVLHEVRWLPDVEELKECEYPTSAAVLRALALVMDEIEPGETSLVDLYANKGNADPYLVACAIDGMGWTEDHLFGPNWVVVSDDNAVQRMADAFGVSILPSAEFLQLL